MSTTHPIEPGSLARVSGFIAEDGMSPLRDGLEFVVEDYVNETDSEDGIPFYWGSRPGNMNDVVVRAAYVELVKSSAEMDARKLPTPAEIAELIGNEVLGFSDLNLNEADYSAKDGTLEIYGRTKDGLPFGADIKVIRVTQVDD